VSGYDPFDDPSADEHTIDRRTETAMPRLWVGNFDFEHQLADPGRTPSQRLRRLNAELATCWLAVADDGDVIWTPEPIPTPFWDTMAAAGLPRVTPVGDWRSACDRYDLMPWGWTAGLLSMAARQSPSRDLPPVEAVRTANSRRWSFAREQEWQVGLPHAACCTSIFEVLRAMSSLPERDAAWVIKAEFGMSGRERILGRGPLTDSATDWLRKRLAADGFVFFEPWVECVVEAGILFDVPTTGSPALIGVAEMLPSSRGQYPGSVFAGNTGDLDWSPAVEIAARAAGELQRLGHVGPLGIDAMWFRTTEGELRLRPLQDVNARWTMGRLALGWRRFFPEATWGVWTHHRTWPTGNTVIPHRQSSAGEILTPNPYVITTSPDIVGDQPARHRTTLVVHPRV
jgi:hypothetical protein